MFQLKVSQSRDKLFHERMCSILKKYFKDTSNLVSFVIGGILSFVFFIFNKNMKVPIWLLLIVVFFLAISIWLLIKSRIELKEHTPNTHIQIIECSHGVCICKPNNLIAHSSWVTFYRLSGNYEQVIAYGTVQNITQRGAAQVQVFPINSEEQTILETINNEKANIFVRPSLTTEAIRDIADLI